MSPVIVTVPIVSIVLLSTAVIVLFCAMTEAPLVTVHVIVFDPALVGVIVVV